MLHSHFSVYLMVQKQLCFSNLWMNTFWFDLDHRLQARESLPKQRSSCKLTGYHLSQPLLKGFVKIASYQSSVIGDSFTKWLPWLDIFALNACCLTVKALLPILEFSFLIHILLLDISFYVGRVQSKLMKRKDSKLQPFQQSNSPNVSSPGLVEILPFWTHSLSGFQIAAPAPAITSVFHHLSIALTGMTCELHL